MLENANFKKVEFKDLSIISDFVSSFDPYSDFNPISLICWDNTGNNMYTIENDALIIKITDYLKNRTIHSILGKNLTEDIFYKLLDYPEEVKMIPEISLQNIDTNLATLEDRDSFDYIIDLKSFRGLEGGSYKALRKRINNFKKQNESCEVILLDLKNTRMQREILDLTVKWSKNKAFTSEKLQEDIYGVEQYIKVSENFNCSNVGLYLNDKLIGYSFSQLLGGGWAMGHFGKTDINYENSSLYLEYEADNILNAMGAHYLNLQQDTGLVGLRQTKMSYRPIKFLKKYTLTKRG